MQIKIVSRLLCLGIAFTLLTGCGDNSGNMDGNADMASENGTLQPGSETLQGTVTVQAAQGTATVQIPGKMPLVQIAQEMMVMQKAI